MANSANDLQLRELKDTIKELNTLIRELKDTLKTVREDKQAVTQERDNLKEEVALLKKKLFGSSSEKRSFEIEGQLNLFDEAEVEQSPVIAEVEELDAITPAPEKKTRGRKTNAERFKGIPVVKEYLDLSEEEKVCAHCETPLEQIGEEFVRREIQFVPAKIKIIEYYSLNYKCPVCEKDDDRELPYIFKGKTGKPHMIHGMASAGTVAWIMYQKFCNSMPFYRQETDWKQMGITISRASMANWTIQNAAEFFQPMYDFFHRKLMERGFLMADETPVQVLHEEDRRAQTKSYMWLFRTGEDGGVPIILYKYSKTRAGDTAVNFLEGYNGYLMCDGYSGYNKMKDAKRTTCYAHIRRYFTEAVPKGKEEDMKNPAVQGVVYMDKLFRMEQAIKRKNLSFDAIKKTRLAKEKPVIEGFLSWLDTLEPIRGSRLDKAVTYVKNRRDILMTYLEDGRCSFSNNLSENSIRPFTVGRRNWLFNDTPKGADASALVYTMVEMAKANGVNVYQYLTYLLEKLPNDRMTDSGLETLAPWNLELKAELERRVSET